MGRRLFIYYLIQKSLIILMICETIQKKWIVYYIIHSGKWII